MKRFSLLLMFICTGCVFSPPVGGLGHSNFRSKRSEPLPILNGVGLGHSGGALGQGHELTLIMKSHNSRNDVMSYIRHITLKHNRDDAENILSWGLFGGEFDSSFNIDCYYNDEGCYRLGLSSGLGKYLSLRNNTLGLLILLNAYLKPAPDGLFDLFGQTSLQLWWQF